MAKTILLAQHHEGTSLGALEPAIKQAGLEITGWQTWESAEPPIGLDECAGFVCLGGLMNPGEDHEHPFMPVERRLLGEAVERGLPTLGLCLGAQLLAEAVGGRSYHLGRLRLGWLQVNWTDEARTDEITAEEAHFRPYQWHSYAVELPPSATVLARGEDTVQAFRVGSRAWGFQFHPEVTGAIARRWSVSGRDDLGITGPHIDRAIDEIGEHAPASEAMAMRVATRFAAMALEGDD